MNSPPLVPVKTYLTSFSLPVRSDLLSLIFISSVCGLIVLHQGMDLSPYHKFIFTISICLIPVYSIFMLVGSRAGSRIENDPSASRQRLGARGEKDRERSIAKKKTSGPALTTKAKASFSEISLLLFVFFFALSVLLAQSYLLLISFAVMLAGSLYDIYTKGRFKKIANFFSRVYLQSGLLPYFLCMLTVSLSYGLTVALDVIGPVWLHYQWKPFNDMKLANSLLPLLSAMETGYMGLVILTMLLMLLLFPFLAYEEERIFRYKRLSYGSIIRGALIFGPVHVLCFVPLYAGLSLIVTGLLFSLFYNFHYLRMMKKHPLSPKRAAFLSLFPVTCLHALHNSLIFIAFFTLYILQG